MHKGFNVISGVSGSGKSVFLHAMLSAFGLKESHAALVEINLTLRLKELGICLEDFGIAGDLDTDDFDIKDSNVKDSVIQADSNKQIKSKTNKDSKMQQVSSTNEDSALQTDINVQIDSNVKDLVAQTELKHNEMLLQIKIYHYKQIPISKEFRQYRQTMIYKQISLHKNFFFFFKTNPCLNKQKFFFFLNKTQSQQKSWQQQLETNIRRLAKT